MSISKIFSMVKCCEKVGRKNINSVLLAVILFCFSQYAFSQNTDSARKVSPLHISGFASITNNGISFIPSFSLGKPATIFYASVAKKRFSFDPELRFSLSAKPWTFLFWGRYQLATASRFKMSVGTHLGLNFRATDLPVNGVSTEVMVVRRYLAGELSPKYLLTKNISVGMYYLYSRGLDPGTIKNTNFLTINSNFSNIGLSKQFFMRVTPQVYYLKQDAHDGFFVTSAFTLAKRDFPLSVSAVINKTLRTDIPGSKDFLWNATLIYSFNHNYVKSR